MTTTISQLRSALTELGFAATADLIDEGDITSAAQAHRDLDWHWGHADRGPRAIADTLEAFNAARTVIDACAW